MKVLVPTRTQITARYAERLHIGNLLATYFSVFVKIFHVPCYIVGTAMLKPLLMYTRPWNLLQDQETMCPILLQKMTILSHSRIGRTSLSACLNPSRISQGITIFMLIQHNLTLFPARSTSTQYLFEHSLFKHGTTADLDELPAVSYWNRHSQTMVYFHGIKQLCSDSSAKDVTCPKPPLSEVDSSRKRNLEV